jgi:hypothetical protein
MRYLSEIRKAAKWEGDFPSLVKHIEFLAKCWG